MDLPLNVGCPSKGSDAASYANGVAAGDSTYYTNGSNAALAAVDAAAGLPTSSPLTAAQVAADLQAAGPDFNAGVAAVAAVSPASASTTAAGVSGDKVAAGWVRGQYDALVPWCVNGTGSYGMGGGVAFTGPLVIGGYSFGSAGDNFLGVDVLGEYSACYLTDFEHDVRPNPAAFTVTDRRNTIGRFFLVAQANMDIATTQLNNGQSVAITAPLTCYNIGRDNSINIEQYSLSCSYRLIVALRDLCRDAHSTADYVTYATLIASMLSDDITLPDATGATALTIDATTGIPLLVVGAIANGNPNNVLIPGWSDDLVGLPGEGLLCDLGILRAEAFLAAAEMDAANGGTSFAAWRAKAATISTALVNPTNGLIDSTTGLLRVCSDATNGYNMRSLVLTIMAGSSGIVTGAAKVAMGHALATLYQADNSVKSTANFYHFAPREVYATDGASPNGFLQRLVGLCADVISAYSPTLGAELWNGLTHDILPVAYGGNGYHTYEAIPTNAEPAADVDGYLWNYAGNTDGPTVVNHPLPAA